jgi:SAM-dependent methyltransferase
MNNNNDSSNSKNNNNKSSPKDYDQEAKEQQEHHWAFKLFIEHPELYLPFLEQGKEKALREVEGLCKIFDEYKVPKDSKILDLSCGIGRHSIPLAKRGYKVIGYDISSLYLQKAREWAKREGLMNDDDIDNESKSNTIKFYQGDLRDAAKVLSNDGQTDFTAIISMETSFGYFGEEADYQLFEDLTNLCSSCSANSPYSYSPIFVIDTINRDYLIREFQPFGINDISEEKLELHIRRKFNFESSSMEEEWRFYDRRRKRRKKRKNNTSAHNAPYLRQILDLHLNLRVYSLHELIRLLGQAGWNCISKYGDIVTLEPFNRGSRNMVLVSQKMS